MSSSFSFSSGSDWTSPDNQDHITDRVWITRGDKKGIFNIAQEPGYKPSPPEGTEWAYGAAKDWKSLRFHSWETCNSRIPPDMVGVRAVLHLIEDDIYLDIKFLSWSSDDTGGGFSYVRAANDPLTIDDGPIALPSRVNIENAFVSFQIVVSDTDGDPIACDWDFGDGTTGSGTSTGHTYTAAGDYAVTVTVSDGSVTHVRSLGIEVNTTPRMDTGPTATPPICVLGDAISFAASATDDDGDPLTYVWSFGDGKTANGAGVSHTYASAGSHTVVLDVTDGVVNETVRAVPISLDCRIEVDGGSFFADRTVAYTGKTGKAGKFK